MNRPRFLAGAAAALIAASPRAASAAEVALTTATGDLYGTLLLPRVVGPTAVVLIISGSGPTDRDGNTQLMSGKNDALKLLAEALADRGVASLRYDKRGVGASRSAEAVESELRFDTFVDDAAAWIVHLRRMRKFSRVVVAGHSEGSLIGMLAGQRAAIDGFASLEGAGHRAGTILRDQFRNTAPAFHDAAYSVIAALEAGKTVAPPAEVASFFRPSVQPYLISWFRVDPAQELRRLHAPTVIVQGTADIQVAPPEGQVLETAMPSARYVLVAGMNHVLKYAPDTSSQTAIVAGYINPSLPVVPEVVKAVAGIAS